MRYDYRVLDVFTDRRYAGNPLAVVPDAAGLSDAQLQKIAAEFNLSETVFVLPPRRPGNLANLRIFTPRRELDFAGHPTVGTALLLAELGRVAAPTSGDVAAFVLEEAAGEVTVTVAFQGGLPVRAEFKAPRPLQLGARLAVDTAAAMLGLVPEQVAAGGTMPVFASCGLPFLLIELRDSAALASAVLSQAGAAAAGEGVFIATRDTGDHSVDWRARVFAPLDGIAEDPATGSAAAAFAGVLAAQDPRPRGEFVWRIGQGIEMGRPSLISTRVLKTPEATTAYVAGAAILVAKGTIEAD